MDSDEIRLYGQVATENGAEELASLTRGVAFDIRVTTYGEIKARDDHGTVVEVYPADPGEYLISVDADSPAALRAMAEQLSAFLSEAGIRHRIEIYSEAGALAKYLHHSWPLINSS